jgi:Arf-GAP/coiled-coil/ANK repeat/PH domain-containing protein
MQRHGSSPTPSLAETLPITHKSGYLFERKHGRVYQSWSRKYYTISNGELICTTRNPKVKKKKA